MDSVEESAWVMPPTQSAAGKGMGVGDASNVGACGEAVGFKVDVAPVIVGGRGAGVAQAESRLRTINRIAPRRRPTAPLRCALTQLAERILLRTLRRRVGKNWRMPPMLGAPRLSVAPHWGGGLYGLFGGPFRRATPARARERDGRPAPGYACLVCDRGA